MSSAEISDEKLARPGSTGASCPPPSGVLARSDHALFPLGCSEGARYHVFCHLAGIQVFCVSSSRSTDRSECAYLRELFERLDVGVLVADDAAFYIDVNRAACKLFGRSRSDIVGHHLSEFIENARAAEVNVQWRAFLRDGVQDGVFAIQLPDGSPRLFQFQARANVVAGVHCSLVTPVADHVDSPEAQNWITVCAWTKRVRFRGEWLSMENYLLRAHGLSISHGICPDAFGEMDSCANQFPTLTKE